MAIYYFILILAVCLTVVSQILLKTGMNQIGEINLTLAGLGRLISQAATNYYIIGSLVGLGVSFLMWLVVLSKLKLNVTIPFTSLNFVLVLLFSWLFLKESISGVQLVGMAAIIFGLFLVAR